MEKVYAESSKNYDGISIRAYFRKAGHACGMNNNGHILVNLGQFRMKHP